ncbi:MAG: nickel pincer cofactor biosynthesis protein LarC [Huintestinicola sp.]
MKTLFLDCSMGAAGDMLSAALYELIDCKEDFLKKINSAGLEGVEISAEETTKCGICGTHFSVKINGEEEHEHHHDHHHEHEHHHHEHEHHHSSMSDIENIINGLSIGEDVKKDAVSVYKLIAEAESHVHGKPVTDIHFHEVGTMDAIGDIVTVCTLIKELSPDRIVASPVCTGFGQVSCAHGILPVPAPATAHILKGVPIYGGKIQGELCTPTGAALLKHFVSEYGDMPLMTVNSIGYGMGNKDFEAANCVRAMLGEEKREKEKMYELCCNVDDMTAEAVSYASEKLMEVCADVFTVPIGMKKSRPATMICALCSEDKREEAAALMLRHTTTLGVREKETRRYVLERYTEMRETKYGAVRVKLSSGYGINREKYEFDDISRIAEENNMSIEQVLKEI